MNRKLRILIPAALLAPVVVAGALLATQPWGGETAESQARIYRFCEITVQVPPGLIASLSSDPYTGEPSVVVQVPDYDAPVPTSIVLDPMTGAEIGRNVTGTDDDAILNNVVVSRADEMPPSPAWPWADVPPATQAMDVSGGVSYRPPDPEAGIQVQVIGADNSYFRFKTCKSEATFDLETREVNTDKVHPSEADMFERLLSEVK